MQLPLVMNTARFSHLIFALNADKKVMALFFQRIQVELIKPATNGITGREIHFSRSVVLDFATMFA